MWICNLKCFHTTESISIIFFHALVLLFGLRFKKPGLKVQLVRMVSAGVRVLGEGGCVCVRALAWGGLRSILSWSCASSGKAYNYSTTVTKTTYEILLCHKNASVLLAKMKMQLATLYLYNPLNTGVLGFHFQIVKKQIVTHCLLNPLSDGAAWNFAVVCRISNQVTLALLIEYATGQLCNQFLQVALLTQHFSESAAPLL